VLESADVRKKPAGMRGVLVRDTHHHGVTRLLVFSEWEAMRVRPTPLVELWSGDVLEMPADDAATAAAAVYHPELLQRWLAEETRPEVRAPLQQQWEIWVDIERSTRQPPVRSAGAAGPKTSLEALRAAARRAVQQRVAAHPQLFDRRVVTPGAMGRPTAWWSVLLEYRMAKAKTKREKQEAYEIYGRASDIDSYLPPPPPPLPLQGTSDLFPLDDVGAAPPSFADYQAFMREKYIPWFNGLNRGVRLCMECGTLFAIPDERHREARFCSDRCSAPHRQGGTRGNKAGIRAAKSAGRLMEHVKGCARCRGGGSESCPLFQAEMLKDQDALSRSRELGRTRKRRSP
jgi:hypothetical protein